jgi:hypothetical protein
MTTNTTERLAGFHRRHLLAIVDEASGVDDPIFEALDSLNPSRTLLIGNPLRAAGTFYDRAAAARDGRAPQCRLIHVSSLESPHIGLPRSPWGLADSTWLERVRNDYGAGSRWYRAHVEGLFPSDSTDQLLPGAWLDRAAAVPRHTDAGRPRVAVDPGLGTGGDRTVIVCRDDNGILAMEADSRWCLETTATRVSLMAQRFGVQAPDITWDVAGIGADFANRLQAVALVGCQPYRGGAGGGTRFGNFRAAAAWRLRQRLDPERRVGPANLPQAPFRIPPAILAAGLREELLGLRYEEDRTGRICLEAKDDFARRLRRSPDRADAVAQSFAFVA